MRVMGHPPMKIAEFDQYLAELRPLLCGEEANVVFRGAASPVRHIMADDGFVAFDPAIPLYVSGFGPKSLALAGKHGDGAVMSVPPVAGSMEHTWASIERGAASVGRTIDRDRFLTCSLTTIAVLEPGEAPDSPRVKQLCGAFAMASLHYTYDQFRNFGRPPSPVVAPMWEDYRTVVEQTPPDRIHQRIHAGHNCWVLPEEERFVTRELIEATCLVGTVEQLRDRLGRLEEDGLDQIMILPNFDPRYEVLESVADALIA